MQQQPSRKYQSDGVKRIGTIWDAYRRSLEDDVTLKIKELGSGDEIKGYVSSCAEYGVKSQGFISVSSDRFVFYTKRTKISMNWKNA